MTKPTGKPVSYPICGDWACDDEEDWEVVGPDDEKYSAVKRERSLAAYHEPRTEWRQRLQVERDRLANGDPLWTVSTPTPRRPKASDISDEAFFDALDGDGRWTSIWTIADRLGFPGSVTLAKARTMVERRGTVHGCYCGCIGGFHPAATCRGC